MQLQDLKPSISQLGKEEAILIHREVRKNRITPIITKQKKTTVTKMKKDSKNKQEIKNDPDKIKELLKLLGEDV